MENWKSKLSNKILLSAVPHHKNIENVDEYNQGSILFVK